MTDCLVCLSSNVAGNASVALTNFDCPRCGRWALTAEESDFALFFGRKYSGDIPLPTRSWLSHKLRRQTASMPNGRFASVSIADLDSWSKGARILSPAEQVDELILWIGDNQPSPAEFAHSEYSPLASWIGSAIPTLNFESAFIWMIRIGLPPWGESKALVSDFGFRLTFPGWERYEALKRGKIESRNVLMAMEFGHDDLNAVVQDCFKPAVEHAGFALRTINEGQGAGLIDDQLRVALRTSRFVVADITHRNNGAYWEAGFAEGLGRPVIYTCRDAEWEERASHFDTNHLVTVIWKPDNLVKAASDLTATIRATLPSEATLED